MDLGTFSIPRKIKNLFFNRTMVDLGASINLMPSFDYDKINLEELKKTILIIQLTDSIPDKVLEDILVQVNELIF